MPCYLQLKGTVNTNPNKQINWTHLATVAFHKKQIPKCNCEASCLTQYQTMFLLVHVWHCILTADKTACTL